MTEAERYTFIMEKLLESSSKETILEDIHNQAKQLSKLSSRHHYLPQYYIKGFCGSDGKLAVYDKKSDKIHTIRKSPKSVFFELDRHTVETNGLKLSMLEDQLFKDTDNRLSPYIIKLRDEPHTENLLTNEIQINMFVFLLDLFWRNPSADYAANTLFQQSNLTWVDEATGISHQDDVREKEFKEDPFNIKFERFKIQAASMLHIANRSVGGETYSKLWEFKNSPFILGDFPMIFSKTPRTHIELETLDHFLPISSNRLYACNQLNGLNFSHKDSLIINALQIDQAVSHVVSSSSKVLEESIAFFKSAKKDGSLVLFKKYLFMKI